MTESESDAPAPADPTPRGPAGNAETLQQIGDDYRSGSGQPEDWPEGSEPQAPADDSSE